MSRVPLVNIEPFLKGGSTDREQVAPLVDAACQDSGFLMVAGHGVPTDLMQAYTDHLTAFFAAPLADKQRIGVTRDSNRGYRGKDATALAHSRGDYTPPDLMARWRQRSLVDRVFPATQRRRAHHLHTHLHQRRQPGAVRTGHLG